MGHSTRTIEDFLALLRAFRIEMIVDVRTVARSRHNPQYNAEELGGSLHENGIYYHRIEGLGGFRHTTAASVNRAWNNVSFRGYADYMQTPEFTTNLEKLIHVAAKSQTAIMCAEAVPWRCHRSLIGDALIVRGVLVEDIMTAERSTPHRLTSFAKAKDGKITYPLATE